MRRPSLLWMNLFRDCKLLSDSSRLIIEVVGSDLGRSVVSSAAVSAVAAAITPPVVSEVSVLVHSTSSSSSSHTSKF